MIKYLLALGGVTLAAAGLIRERKRAELAEKLAALLVMQNELDAEIEAAKDELRRLYPEA